MGLREPFLFPTAARLGTDNAILHARARQHRVDGYAGPLSIKTVVKGSVAWVVQGRELIVTPSSFLIISAGERYSMNIDAATPVETCCAFFAPGYVERIAMDSTSPLERALDDPDRETPAMPYLSALHGDREEKLISRLRGLAPRCSGTVAPIGLDEEFIELADALLHFYEEIRAQAQRIPAAREATRWELFRRLLQGRDYLHANCCGALSLKDVSRAACLSPYHFHRGFTAAFQQTPHAYLTGLRLAQARWMLESGWRAVDACIEVGFSSPSAFSRLFRAKYSETPSAVRRKFASSGK